MPSDRLNSLTAAADTAYIGGGGACDGLAPCFTAVTALPPSVLEIPTLAEGALTCSASSTATGATPMVRRARCHQLRTISRTSDVQSAWADRRPDESH
jgi:hypothetical protein